VSASPPKPVPVAELERARARHLLGACAELLWLHALDGWSERLLSLQTQIDDSAAARMIEGLYNRLRRDAAIALMLRGVGYLPPALLSGTGPIARAAGLTHDARSLDPAYSSLGFEPVTHARGDVEARFLQRLREAAQSLELAARAGERAHEPGAPLETPRGNGQVAAERWSGLLAHVAANSSWDAFVSSLVSLDLDPAQLPATEDYGDAQEGPTCQV